MRLLLAVMLLSGCTKKADAEATPKSAPEKAEVEFTGDWKSNVEAQSYFFVVQKEPCRPFLPSATTYGVAPLSKQGPLFAELFMPQATIGHVCIFAKDAGGKVVGVASWDRNPGKFEGQGEVVVGPLNLVVDALAN